MIDSYTQLFAVFGNPVRHSKSPCLHNYFMAAHGINAVYMAFEIQDIENGVRAIRELGMTGVSITIPYKESIIPFLDEIDDRALSIGAVNTVVRRGDRLYGYNTDYQAAVDPLRSSGITISGKRVCIIGAGGAARAVAYGIQKENGTLFVANRSELSAKTVAEKNGGTFIDLQDLHTRDFDILINTTPVGMTPKIEESPVPSGLLKPGMVVMDIVYAPLDTLLLKQARAKGCLTIDGLHMFVSQGAAQFELWTGYRPDIDSARHYLTERGQL